MIILGIRLGWVSHHPERIPFLFLLSDSCYKRFVCTQEDRRIAAIKAVRAASEDELPVLAEKAFHQLKDNTGCGGRVKRNRAVWPVTLRGMAFYKKHCVFMAG